MVKPRAVAACGSTAVISPLVRGRRAPWGLATRWIALVLVVAAVPACHKKADPPILVSAGAPPAVPSANQPPVFAGLKTIVTAGGAEIRLGWEAANDDADLPAAIRYRIFRASTSGGQNFATPLLTTPAGATSAVVAGVVGTESFYGVRALDTSNASDSNTVELSAIPIPDTLLVFVDDSAPGPGTGTFADPFTSIQAAVTLGEVLPGGAAILVAAGTYNEAVDLTVSDTTPLTVTGGFPDWSTFGGTQPAAAAILAAFDPAANLSTVDGTGQGLFTVEVNNLGRPTALRGLRITEADVVAILGANVLLEVSGCTVRDPAGGQVTAVAAAFLTNVSTPPNRVTIVGNDFREFSTALGLEPSGVSFGGVTASMRIASNFIGHSQATPFGSIGVDGGTVMGPIIVPTGGSTSIEIHGNRIFRTNTHGVFLDFEPELVTAAGTLAVSIRGNRVEFVDAGDAVHIEDFSFFGDVGSGSLTVEGNRFVSMGGQAVDLDYLVTAFSGDPIDGPTTSVIRDNWMVLCDGGFARLQNIIPSAGGTASYTFQDNECSQIESTAFNVDSVSPGVAGPADGKLVFVMKGNVIHTPSNGDTPDLFLHVPPGALGLLSVAVEGNTLTTPDGTPYIGLDVDQVMGVDPAGTVYNAGVIVKNNVITDTNANTGNEIQIDTLVSNGRTTVEVTGNTMTVAGTGIQVTHNDFGDPLGPPGASSVTVASNTILSTSGSGIMVDVDATGGGATVLDVLHNRIAATNEALSVEVYTGGAANGRIYSTIFNNRIDASNSTRQLDYNDLTDSAKGDAAYALIRQNTVSIGIESSGTQVRVADHGLVDFSRNLVGYGEVDSDDGLVLSKAGVNPGSIFVRNCLVVYNPGDGVFLAGPDMTPQFVNTGWGGPPPISASTRRPAASSPRHPSGIRSSS